MLYGDETPDAFSARQSSAFSPAGMNVAVWKPRKLKLSTSPLCTWIVEAPSKRMPSKSTPVPATSLSPPTLIDNEALAALAAVVGTTANAATMPPASARPARLFIRTMLLLLLGNGRTPPEVREAPRTMAPPGEDVNADPPVITCPIAGRT